MFLSLSTLSVLAFGFALGLKHAIEVDHLAAVSTIVSRRKSLWSASLAGGLWGVGHTLSLVIAGLAVLMLHLQIGARTAQVLEFCVALMLMVLGLNALRRIGRGARFHMHVHQHGFYPHVHPHSHLHRDGSGSHEHLPEPAATGSNAHTGLESVAKPLIVGMMHGLAGSAALMLLVLSTISSPVVGMSYILVFGIGSVGGMMLMSALVSLPMRFTAARGERAQHTMQRLAGLFSLAVGLFMAYDIGFPGGLFGR